MFSHADPAVWNSLPASIQASPQQTLPAVKTQLVFLVNPRTCTVGHCILFYFILQVETCKCNVSGQLYYSIYNCVMRVA